jgi:hypothetical protein
VGNQLHLLGLRPLLRGLCAGQDVFRLVAHHHVALLGHEADDQAEDLLRPAGIVPGDPHAVGMAEFRLAVVLRKLLLGEHELAIRFDVVGVATRFVERIDDQRPRDLDRLALLVVVEHQAPAEPALGRLVRLVEHGVGPHGYDLGGGDRRVVLPRPGDLVQIQLRAARQCGGNRCRQQQAEGSADG